MVWLLIQSPGSLGDQCGATSTTVSTQRSTSLHSVRLVVPRQFYVNLRVPKLVESGTLFCKVGAPVSASSAISLGSTKLASRMGHGFLLPRSHALYHLYEYKVPELVFQAHAIEMQAADLALPEVEGVYEMRFPSLFRAIVRLGCVCSLQPQANINRNRTDHSTTANNAAGANANTFQLDKLRFHSLASLPLGQQSYLPFGTLRRLFLFHYQSTILPTTTTGGIANLAPRQKEALRQVR
ncbi:unnamed protein product [Protopolystoma xenopodis]|uniref:DNA polymerase epsilon catalytic subunit n=1 Tax=Protopolystoma xenopodis TaxID=117903 RepID=A0A3S4ZVW8_9PLAT|nr:unnamed protein product [Protopolystoma xenopodis]